MPFKLQEAWLQGAWLSYDFKISNKRYLTFNMLKLFARYSSIGVVNTLIHWLVFAMLYSQAISQSLANFIAFCVAVTFSFFANAHWTFKTTPTTARYVIYVVFMGAVAAGIGKLADQFHALPVITLIVFSVVSLISGFVYSNFIVFKVKK